MTETARPKCAIYLRVSLDRDDNRLAVTRQEKTCRELAAARGWEIVELFTDNSISASKAVVRPQYERMVEEYLRGSFTAIICWDLDRLSRQPRQLEDWIDAAKNRGLLLVTGNGEADLSTESGIMFARIKASVAASEVALKSKRQIAAAAQRISRGVVPSGIRLTGYDIKGVVVPEEAVIVAQMFADFLAGITLSGIATGLTEAGVPTRRGGAHWPPSSVRTILTNGRYAGLAVRAGKPTGPDGNWEAIVDVGTYKAVQAILEDPRRITNRSGGNARLHLGSGLFICCVCGGRLQSNGPQYWCRVGGHVARGRERIDQTVRAAIRHRLSLPDLPSAFVVTDDAIGMALAEQARGLRMAVDEIDADYDARRIKGERYQVAMEKVLAELAIVESKQLRQAAGSHIERLLAGGSPASAFDAASLQEQRSIIDSLVIVTPQKGMQGRKGFDPASVLIEWRQHS